jgi:hypothetical protein
MFGLGKTKIAQSDAAVLMTQMAFSRVLKPLPDEIPLATIAKSAGVAHLLLSFELLCLSIWVLGAIINRMRLEGLMRERVAKSLIEEIFRYIQFLLSKDDTSTFFPPGIDSGNAFDFLLMRYERYCGPGWTVKNSEQVMAEVIGIFSNYLSKKPEKLHELAFETIVLRGNVISDWLKKVKIT